MCFVCLFYFVVGEAFLLSFRVLDVVFLWSSCGIWRGEDGQQTVTFFSPPSTLIQVEVS
jgi:hypothetical protein